MKAKIKIMSAALGLSRAFRSLANFFQDRHCEFCGTALSYDRFGFCQECEESGIFDTLALQHPGNKIEKALAGLTKTEAASALMKFSDDTKARTLIHNLKYHNDRNTGIQLGKVIGRKVKSDPRYSDIDFIIPVPLHPNKQEKRGFNQSEMIALGINSILNTQISTDNLYRTRDNESQTLRHKGERIKNTQGLFAIKNPGQYSHKNILLIDDVFTSGSTIIECCKALSQSPDIKIFIYTVAATHN